MRWVTRWRLCDVIVIRGEATRVYNDEQREMTGIGCYMDARSQSTLPSTSRSHHEDDELFESELSARGHASCIDGGHCTLSTAV